LEPDYWKSLAEQMGVEGVTGFARLLKWGGCGQCQEGGGGNGPKIAGRRGVRWWSMYGNRDCYREGSRGAGHKGKKKMRKKTRETDFPTVGGKGWKDGGGRMGCEVWGGVEHYTKGVRRPLAGAGGCGVGGMASQTGAEGQRSCGGGRILCNHWLWRRGETRT